MSFGHTYECLGVKFNGLAECEKYAKDLVEKGRKEVVVYKDEIAFEAFQNKDGQVKFIKLRGCIV